MNIRKFKKNIRKFFLSELYQIDSNPYSSTKSSLTYRYRCACVESIKKVKDISMNNAANSCVKKL